ncbi:hypothetical protein Bca4012_044564 [Brassica carinata]
MALRYDISGPRSSSSSILGRNGSVSRPRDLTTMGLVREWQSAILNLLSTFSVYAI